MHEQIDSPRTDDRFASFRAGDGTTVIYDRENTDAWIQSDVTRSLE